MFTNPYIFEELISRGAFWRPPRCPPWGHNVRIALCFSPAGRANASCLPWALKRPSRPPPLASEDRERSPKNGVREAGHCSPTEHTESSQSDERA